MKNHFRSAIFIASFLTVAASDLDAARAADLSVPSTQGPAPAPVIKPYEFTVFAYGWAAGLKGNVASLPPLPAVNVDLGFDKVIKNFEGGIMGAAELRFGRILFDTDIMYTRIGGAVNPRGPFFDRVSLKTTSFIGTALAGYRLVDDPSYTLDVMAGLRGYSLSTKVTTSSRVPALNLVGRETESWVDPMIGAKARINLTRSFYVTSWALIGGFDAGSKLSWDVFGGVGYSFNDQMSAVIGYRAMGIDYARNGYVYDVVQKGPMTAFVFRF